MLTEEKRIQLDGIVKQMIDNKETDDSVQFVVDDFKTKYDMPEVPLQTPQKGVVDKVLDNPITRGIQSFFPGKKVGDAIGTLGGLGLEKAKGLLGGQDNSATYDLSSPTPLQVGGDVVAGAASIAGFKGVGATGSLLSKAGKSAVVGAGLFGGKEAAEGGGAKDIAKSTALGAGVGVGSSLLFSGLEVAASQLKKLPTRLIRSATGQSKKEILAGKGLEKFMLENKKVGTAEGLIKQSQEEMDRLSEVINKNLKSVGVTDAKITTKRLLGDIVKDVNKAGGNITNEEAKEIIDRLAPQARGLLEKPSMGLVTANKLRQSIDRTLGDRGFLTAELPFNKDILRSFTNALREEVKKKAPEGTRGAFNSLSNEIRLSNALTSKVAQGSRNQIISFGDLIGGGIGGLAGGVPGVVLGAAARRVVQSTPFLTGSAVAMDTLNKALTPVLSGMEPSVQTAILQAIASAIEPPQDQ